MRNRTALLHLVPRRVRHLFDQLCAARWRRLGTVAVSGSIVLPEPVDLAAAHQLSYQPVQPGETFGPPGGDWQQRWFRIDIPASDDPAAERSLFWKCQGESTVWLDGEPWSGLDVGHDLCPLPNRACTLWIDCGTYQTFMGGDAQPPLGDQPCRFRDAWIAERQQPAWKASFDLEALIMLMDQVTDGEALRQHRPVDPLCLKLLPRLDRACDRFEREGLAACADELRSVLQQFPAETWQDTATVVGHSHLDLVWLWPEREGERKAVHTAATALRLLERYPEMTFTYSQPASYAAIARRSPALAQRIQGAIRAGRWEATGGMEVESDTHLPCGEALLRGILLGQRAFAALRGSPSRVCWLPDTFGFTACLPQILRAAGIDGFFTTKLGWSEVTSFPYRSFRWRSPDGSEVLAHNAAHHPNGTLTLEQLAFSAARHREAGILPELLLPQGYGDGGGGPTEAMCERARRLADLARSPRVRWGRAEDFFARLASANDGLPLYDGELYLERHQGTFTSQARSKGLYRAAEAALQVREAVRVARRSQPLDDEAWRRVVFYQFHDALPGSSIALVHEQMEAELARLASEQHASARQELTTTSAVGRHCLFTPAAVDRTALVALPGLEASAIALGGRIVPVQQLDGVAVASVHLPSLGGVTWTAASDPAPGPTCVASATALSSDRVHATCDGIGRIASLRIDGWELPLADHAGLVLHSEGTGGDAWDIMPHASDLHRPAGDFAVQDVIAGPVLAQVRSGGRLGERSTLTQTLRVVRGLPWLFVELDIDWQERASWLRFRLPTTLRGRQARFGTPFASVLRDAQPGPLSHEACWEMPASRWAALTDDDGEGAAMISEARYGWHARSGVLHLSLLRAPDSPAPNTDRGRHLVRFAIGRHHAVSDATTETTAGAADLLYLSAFPYQGAAIAGAPVSLVPGSSLAVAWALPTADGALLRLHEVSGRRGVAQVRSSGPIPYAADAHGQHLAPLASSGDGLWSLPYQPNQLLQIAWRNP